MGDRSRFERPSAGEGLPVSVEVQVEGAWTPGPCVAIECGNVVELDVDELAWLVEDSGPKALAALRETDAASYGKQR
jgi:hypothetical protein